LTPGETWVAVVSRVVSLADEVQLPLVKGMLMETMSLLQYPRRITDLIEAKSGGADVHLKIDFEIIPAEFHHRANPFQAYIFLARYAGTIDAKAFEFRKCYARGCPNNLCTHVSQAVNIANRYLQRDYHALAMGGIDIDKKRFSLDDMVIKFDALKEGGPQQLSIPELIGIAKSGKVVTIQVTLELVPAVEHFAGMKNAQTFLSGSFRAMVQDEVYHCHRCFACFQTERQYHERAIAVKVANARLDIVYSEFKDSGIIYGPQFFS
jgi:hypothetical protein